jgi:hypothetical protein
MLRFWNGLLRSTLPSATPAGLQKSELYLVRDPLQVLPALESALGSKVGLSTRVAFLTDGICPQPFEELSSLMDERKCDLAFQAGLVFARGAG